MKQAWNDPLPDGIKPPVRGMMIYENAIRAEDSTPVISIFAPVAIVPLHVAMMELDKFCEQHQTEYTLAKRGFGGSAHMICQISKDGRVMSYAAMFGLPDAIMRAIEGARVWIEQRNKKAA